MVDAVEELLYYDSIVFNRVLYPFIKAWRRVSASSYSVSCGGALDIDGSLGENIVVGAAGVGDQAVDGVRADRCCIREDVDELRGGGRPWEGLPEVICVGGGEEQDKRGDQHQGGGNETAFCQSRERTEAMPVPATLGWEKHGIESGIVVVGGVGCDGARLIIRLVEERKTNVRRNLKVEHKVELYRDGEYVPT